MIYHIFELYRQNLCFVKGFMDKELNYNEIQTVTLKFDLQIQGHKQFYVIFHIQG